MPSQHQSADTSSRARYPERQTEIGEDPARWLDRDILGRSAVKQQADPDSEFGEMRLATDTDVSTYGMMLRARIRGIDKLPVIRHWLEVEHDLDRGPRDTVVELLQERADELKNIGERPDRLQHGPRLPPEWTFEPSVGDDVDQKTASEKLVTDGGGDA